jgi:hypothetical protein
MVFGIVASRKLRQLANSTNSASSSTGGGAGVSNPEPS